MENLVPRRSNVPLRVLLVEDSADDAELITLELREQGFVPDLVRVETRAQLHAALDESGWQVLLCDHNLPALDALSALAIVKERQLDLPFIIVSNAIVEALAVKVMRAGAHDYLFKDALSRLGAVIERETKEAEVRAEGKRMQQQLLLSDRLVSVGTLAAGVAHEINNPLAYVLGNLEFALSRMAAWDNAAQGEVAEVIQALEHARDGSERIRATARDLKVFCRSDTEEKTAVNVRRIMESSINIAWNEIRHRARLTRNFEAVPNIVCNENKLGQVFLNLLVNAAQALPEDRAAQNEITVSIQNRADSVSIEVADSGCGIPSETLPRVFEPFFTTKAAGVGSGIGLSICQSIVTDLGGEIQVESRVGVGSVFRVVLPAVGAIASIHPPSVELAPSRRARILVIDDEAELCHVIRRLLSPDHEVHIRRDARDALALIARDRNFDVLFCDLMMPTMSGMEFFAQLQELDAELARRTVFLTGGAFNSQARQFLNGTSNRVIEKPFDARSLPRVIAQVIEAHPVSGTWLTRDARQAHDRAAGG